MPGEVPYTSQLPYLVHPAMKTHPSFVPPTDGSMIQGASPLYANFIPPTQVGGYAGTNQGYCGNTYLPDQQAPITSQSGAGTHMGLVNSTAAFGTQLQQLGQGSSMQQGMSNPTQSRDLHLLQMLQQRASMQPSMFSLAPNDQNFVQASGQQNLYVPAGSMMPQPSAMTPQNNWMHAQPPDRTPHLSNPVGMPAGTMFHAQPTTFVNVYQVPSGVSQLLSTSLPPSLSFLFAHSLRSEETQIDAQVLIVSLAGAHVLLSSSLFFTLAAFGLDLNGQAQNQLQ